MRTILLAAALGLAPGLALADEMLERLEVANEATAENLLAFYRERLPEYADKLPDFTWDDPSRAAATCMLKNIRAAGGEEAVQQYVEATEEWSKVEITSLATIGEKMPPILQSPLAAQVGQSCGANAIAERRMEQSGFDQVLQMPGVMERLTSGG